MQIISGATREPLANPIESVLLHNQAKFLAAGAILIKRNGSEAAIEDSAAPIHDASGQIKGAVIAMGSSLNHRVIAEGVEQQSQLAFLQEQLCEEGHGYFFSRPLALEHFVALLQAGICPTTYK